MNADQPDFSNLERTFRQFNPAPLPDALRQTLEASAPRNHQAALNLQPPPSAPTLSLADRILLLFTSTGILAAALVAALTLWQLTATPRPAPTSPQDFALHQQTLQEMQKLLASR
jgi:hypothetical protein